VIFLDTDIISYYFNANKKIKEKILQAVDNGEDICTIEQLKLTNWI